MFKQNNSYLLLVIVVLLVMVVANLGPTKTPISCELPPISIQIEGED